MHKVEKAVELTKKVVDLTKEIADLTRKVVYLRMKVVDLTQEGKSLYLNCHCRNINQICKLSRYKLVLQQLDVHVSTGIQLFASSFDRRGSGCRTLSSLMC